MSCRSPRCGCKTSTDNCCPPPPHKDKCCAGMLLCDNAPSGAATPFIRLFTEDCPIDLTLNGAPYAVMGTVAPCTEDQTDGCDTTTPVTTAQLCLEDGTPIVVVVQRDCDGSVSAPGWVNLTTGVHTAGVVPAGAAPCDSSVQTAGSAGRLVLCDCTPAGVCVGFLRAIDADGTVTDTTITGLPYVPTGTVAACDAITATAVTPRRVELCDCPPVGPCVGFLRSIAPNGVVTNTTVAGLPYVPTGAVGLCDAAAAGNPPCESPTTPIATAGLTLADGTPIAIVAQRDCNGVVTQTGWINGTTGVFTAGPPPATVRAGGDAEPDLVVLCDTAGDGDITAFVRNYRRNRAGDVVGVTDYTLTGGAYAVTGAVSSCDEIIATAATSMQFELCDCPAVGPCVGFLRTITPDGTIVDSTVAGLPYVPTGTVGLCDAASAGNPPCESPTTPIATVGLCLADGTPIATVAQRDCNGVVTQTGWINVPTGVFTAGLPPAGVHACGDNALAERDLALLCDVAGDGTVTGFVRDFIRDDDGAITGHTNYTLTGTPYIPTGTVGICPPEGCQDCQTQVLCDITDVTSPIGPVPPQSTFGGVLPNGVAWNRVGDGTNIFASRFWRINNEDTFTFSEPVNVQFVGAFTGPGTSCLTMPPGSIPVTIHANHTYNPATRRLCPGAGTVGADQSVFRLEGVTSFTVEGGGGAGDFTNFGNIDVTARERTSFLRTICRDCQASTVSVTDTTMDGTTPYVAAGTVQDCAIPLTAAEPCAPATSSVLCDSTPGDVPVAATNTDPSPYYNLAIAQDAISPAVGGAILAGGTGVFPTSDVGGNHTFLAGVIRIAESAVCGDPDDVTISATIHAVNDGPFEACDIYGRFSLWNGAVQIAGGFLGPPSLAVGGDITATIPPTAVPLADVLAGNVVVEFNLETGSDGTCPAGAGPKSWTVDSFALTAQAAAAGCGTQFLRTYVHDCATSAVTSFTDTTFDGDPYVPVGAVGPCQSAGEQCCPEPVCYAGSGPGEECEPGVLQPLPTIDPTIVDGTVDANPNGFAVSALSATYNGTTVGDWANLNTDGLAPISASPGVVIRYTFNAPTDIAQILLYNNYGFDLNDGDGFGSGTLTVYDAADVVLFTGPLAAGNGAPPFSTTFGGVLEDAAYFTISDLAAQRANPTIGWREVQAIGRYRALITWECPEATISANVEGVLPGVTYDGTTITQTNGPHTFTFSSSGGAFQANIVTDNPGLWSTLQVSDTQPVAVLTGDVSSAFAVRQIPGAVSGISAGMLWPDGTVTDANTGEPVVDPFLVPCVAVREPDHVVSSSVVEMCESGHPFFRQVRVTRDQVVLITDTEIDGRTPYVVVSDAAVTAGPCTPLRLSDACAELGPQLEPSALVGFTQVGDCLVTSAANPTATWTGGVDELAFSTVGTIAGGASFRLLLDGVSTVSASDFTPPIPSFPGTVGDEYSGTATVGGFTITADVVNGSLSGGVGAGGTAFGLAGRMRFTFSPQLSSVAINTEGWPNDPSLQICDVVILPSTDPNPQPLAAYRDGTGTVTYYAVDGTVIDSPVLLPCGACCIPEDGGAPFAPFAALRGGEPVRARGETVSSGPWIPGDHVTGVLQSLTVTGLSGTWSVTDASGGVLTGLTTTTTLRWDNNDGDGLVSPIAITPDAGGSVAVTWTER